MAAAMRTALIAGATGATAKRHVDTGARLLDQLAAYRQAHILP